MSQAKKAGRASPLVKLLAYVRPHRKYALITVFFGVLGLLLSFAYPWIIGEVVDLVGANASRASGLEAREVRLAHLTELAAATAFLHAAIVYGRGHFNVHLGDGIVTDIRRHLFDHLQTLSLRFFAKARTGAIVARLLYDVREATALVYTGVIVAALDVVQLVVAIALLGAISWKLTLGCLVLFPVYGLVFAMMSPRVQRASEQVQLQMTTLSANVTEQIAGQALTKTYVAEAREARRFGEGMLRQHALVVAQSHEGHLVAASGEVLVHIGTTMVIGYGGWLALHGSLTPGTVTRFLGYMLILFGPVRRFAELNITYQSSLSAMRRVFRLLEVQPSVVEPLHPQRKPPMQGHVRFEDVRFRYADDSDETRHRLEDDGEPRSSLPGGAWVLDGVTLEARPGERWSGSRVRARRPCSRCCPGCTTSAAAGSPSTGSTFVTTRFARCGRRSPSCNRNRFCSRARSGTTSPTAARRLRGKRWSRPRWPPTPTSSSPACPAATTPSLASEA
jgi:ABC-type multidrug transport system fused ATPase/permease subunit